MSNTRSNRKKNLNVIRPLESLEDRRLMTISSWDLVSTSDSAYNEIPTSGPVDNTSYSIRALVEYYNTVYNGEANQPFTIVLGNGTYTLSEVNPSLPENGWQGRNDNYNYYGDLDINPAHTFAPLIIQGPVGGSAVLTCSIVDSMAPLDRLIQVYAGSLQLQNVTLKGGLSWDNATGNSATDALGGAVLVNPGGALSLTNCKISSNAASATRSTHAGSAGLNAAGGGIYGCAGSVISLNGSNVFNANRAIAGKGGISATSTGLSGGNAFGAGLSMVADVSEPGPYSTSETIPSTELSINAESSTNTSFINNRLNSYINTNGIIVSSGGTGGAGSGTGGKGGNASGAGLYVGSGQLNLNGGSTNSPITFIGNQARGGSGAITSTGVSGANGTAYGAGVYYMPGQVTVANAPSSSTVSVSVPNYGFETPSLGDGNFTYGTTGASWAFLGSSGISNNNSGFTDGNPDAPQGDQVGILQENGSFSQTISGFASGKSYDMTFYAAQRDGYPQQSISVQLGGLSLGTFVPENTTYQLFRIEGINPGTGSYTLTFTGLNPYNQDETVFVDDIVITSETGILEFSNNSINNTLSSIYIPTVETGDIGYTSADGPWTLRTAVAALNPLVATGMNLSLDLPAGNISLVNSTSGSNTGSISVVNTGTGAFTIVGASESGSIISNSNLTTSIFNLSSADVTFSNLTITGSNTTANGGAITQSGGSSTLNDVTLSYNKSGNGGAFYSYGGSFAMIGGSVIGNSAPSGAGGGFFFNGGMAATLSDVNVSQNSAATSGGYGGGLMQDAGGSLTIKNKTKIQNNSAASGAGLYVTGTVVLNGGKISNNTASSIGGGMVISTGGNVNLSNVSVVSNKVASGSTPVGTGGGIYQGNASLNLLGSTVVDNNSAGNYGGVFSGNSKLIATGTKFSGNSASGNGGGLGITNGGTADLSGVTFSGNAASNGLGGGIYQNGGSVNIKNGSKFKSNSASQGGAAYSTNGTTSMNGGIVQNNKAVYYGGGLLSYNNNLNVTGVSVITNALTSGGSPSGSGGGLSQTGSGTLNLKNSVVNNNSAAQGGGLFFYTSTLNVINTTFKSNTATSLGAGICASNNTKAMNFTSANIKSNTISGTGAAYGAGIYVSGGTLNTKGFNLNNNKITATNNATIEGAGIYATGTSINFNGGTTNTTTISGNQLVGSGGGTAYGAGISAQSGTSINDQSVITFSNNTITSTANGVGGAIAFFANTSYASSYSTTCTGNSANAGGNDYAFELAVNTDNNNSSDQNGPSGISYFTNTSGSASLRNAIEYCQTWMNGNSNNNSMAIMLPSTSNYVLNSGSGQLVTSVPSSDSLTIIGTAGTATIQGWYNRTMYVGGSGTLVLQNVNICGGDVSAGTNAQGGGIYQASGTVTLNNVVMYGNVVTATQTGSDGGNGGQGDNGGGGGTGGNAYGGAYFLAGGILNLTSSATIGGTLSTWQNSVSGAAGGSGGNGGSGGCEHTDFSACKNQIDSGAGGNGGNGGVALGGGIYQSGGTLNSPSGWNNIYNNLATGGSGGGGGNGTSGAPSGDDCKWSGKSGGSSGSTGQAAANYSYDGGNRLFTSKATANAQSVSGSGMTMSGGTLSLNHASPLIQAASQKLNGARFISLELYSVDGSLIATTKSDLNGYYRFNTDFSGQGYIQVVPVANYRAVAKGTTSPDGHKSAFDPNTLRSDTLNFMFGTATNQHVELILNPVEASLKTSRGTVSLVNMSDGSTLWKTKVLPNCYSDGFTTSTYDVNGDNTADYILIPRKGSAKPIFIDGRTGAPTYIANEVSRGLRAGFVVQPFNLSVTPSSNPTTQWVFSPSNNRQGLVSLVDTKVKRSLWTSKQTVFGPTIVTTAISNFQSGSTYGSTPSVILTSVNRFNYKYEKVLDGRNGKVTQIDEKLVGSPLLVQHWKNLLNHKVKPVQGIASKMVSIPRKSLPVIHLA